MHVILLLLFCFNIAQAEQLPSLIKKIKPSIVAIGTYQATRRPQQTVLGTGFIVGNGRYVLTNHHVIPKLINILKKESLSVVSGTGRKAKTNFAELIASDRRNDIALIKLKGKLKFPALPLGDDLAVEEGASIFFIGFPIGSVLGVYPVTHRGIISSITPNVIPQKSTRQLSANMIRRLKDPYGIFQLDATAYPGNSGSPVFNLQGEVIGIVNKVLIKESKESVLEKPSGITYAIPIHFAKKLLTENGVSGM